MNMKPVYEINHFNLTWVFFCLEERWPPLYEICLLTSSSLHEKALITVVALVSLILFSQKKNVYHLGKVLSSIDLF